MEEFDVILLGHFAKDREVVGEKETDQLGGAVYFGAFPLSKMGVKVGVVTKLAREDFSALSELKQENISVFASEAPETTGMKNVYPTEQREERKSYPMGFAGPFDLKDFPDVKAKVIHIGALLKGEVPPEIIRQLSDRAELGLDLQGFVRVKKEDTVVMEEWDAAEDLLPHITYLKADDREIEILTGNQDLKSAAKKASAMGPREVVITHDDGVLVHADNQIYEAPFRPDSLDGRTGRGDTCMATYLGNRAQGVSPENATPFAAALTTLKLEKPGPFKGDIGEVKKLANELRKNN